MVGISVGSVLMRDIGRFLSTGYVLGSVFVFYGRYYDGSEIFGDMVLYVSAEIVGDMVFGNDGEYVMGSKVVVLALRCVLLDGILQAGE